MKHKFLSDIGVYIGAPVIILSMTKEVYLWYFVLGVCLIGLLYSLNTKKKEDRINFTGIIFLVLYTVIFLFRRDMISKYELYIYDTYLMGVFTLALIVPMVLGKSIITKVYKDLLKSRGYNDLAICNYIRKNKLDEIFNKLSSIFAIHLIILCFIRMYSILTYGFDGFESTLDIEVITCIGFIILEVGFLYRAKSKLRISRNILKNKYKHSFTDSRVINLSQYKRANK